MNKQFTASEVRAEANRHANEVEDMLNAFAYAAIDAAMAKESGNG